MGTLRIHSHNLATNDTLESHLMLQLIFPLNNMAHIKAYFLSEMFWSWIGFTQNVATELIYVTILVYAATKLEILQVKFRSFVQDDFELCSSNDKVQEKTDLLKNLIREHQSVILLVVFFS